MFCIFTVCFTGHRPDKFDGWNNPAPKHVLDWLELYIDKIIQLKNNVTFISGAAQGIDQWAAEIVMKKREEYSDRKIRLIMAIPYYDFGHNWPYAAKQKLEEINSKANKMIYVHKGKYTSAYLLQLRNEWMVDHSQLVLAVWDGSTGGTFNCVKYAEKENVKIIRYDFLNMETVKIG